jgi:hypothetical protein
MDYVPPDKNVSVVFLRAYHRLTADAKQAVYGHRDVPS